MPNLLPYLIEASDLRSASLDPSFALRFPRLIEQLVRASLPAPPATIRFPSFDTGQVHGYDGYLDSVGAPPYVPAGKCVYEFKTSETPRPDAEQDYAKRKSQIPSDDAASITFVFITSQSWPGKGEDVQQWAATKRKDGHFKDALVLDATGVVGWLHEYPTVALYGARQILHILPRDFDGQDINEFAETYEGGFEFPMPAAALLAGRDKLATSLREDGLPIDLSTLLADEEEEAAAFVCRALLSTADTDTREQRLATSLVLADEASARALDGTRDLTIILVGSAKQVAARLARTNSVVACRVFGEIATEGAKVLEIPNVQEFTEALSSTGAITRDRALDLSVKNGRSLTILKRHHGNGTLPPVWARPEAAETQEVRAAVLLGAWSEEHAADKSIVELLSSGKYQNTARRLRAYAGQRDALLVELDRVWALRAPVDAFTLLSKYVGEDDLDRFEDALQIVFDAEKDNIPDPNEIYDRSKTNGYSLRIKTGLAQNLLLISALGDVLGIHPKQGGCRKFAADIVKKVPNLGAHPGFLIAFGTQLPYLAEAAPDAFLDALEPLLEGDKNTLKWYLTPYEGRFDLFAGSHVHSLIWALQLIAWLLGHFMRACMTLARLAVADLDINAQGGPRPLSALQSILTPWAPQTSASLSHRVDLVTHIGREAPEIMASLLYGLLPDNMSSVDVHSRPRFADIPDVAVTYGDIWAFDYAVVKALASLPVRDERWSRELSGHLHRLRDDAFEVALSALRLGAAEAQPDERVGIWKVLRAETARHRQFHDADWAMPESRLSQLEALCNSLEPASEEANAFLFDEDAPDLGIRDWDMAEAELRRRRQAAVQQLLSSPEPHALITFVGRVRLPHYVAMALQDLRLTAQQIMPIFIASSGANVPFAEQLSRVAYYVDGENWLELILSSEGELSTEQRQVALNALSPDARLMARLTILPSDRQDTYWATCPVRTWDLEGEWLDVALIKWANNGRSLAAIDQISLKTKGISSSALIELSKDAVQSLLASRENAKRFNSYTFERVLKEMDVRSDIAMADVAKIEWPLVPALYLSRGRTMAIHKLMSTSPDDFIQIISFAYRPKGQAPIDLDEQQRAIADNAGKVLVGFHYSPHLEVPINIGALDQWIGDCTAKADASGHGEIVRLYIGHVLAHSPSDDEDGLWPHRLVRDLVEQKKDAKIESGIETERFNMRGVHSDSVSFYGRHAEEGRIAAERMSAWPRVRSLLERIAESDQNWSESALRRQQKDNLDNSL